MRMPSIEVSLTAAVTFPPEAKSTPTMGIMELTSVHSLLRNSPAAFAAASCGVRMESRSIAFVQNEKPSLAPALPKFSESRRKRAMPKIRARFCKRRSFADGRLDASAFLISPRICSVLRERRTASPDSFGSCDRSPGGRSLVMSSGMADLYSSNSSEKSVARQGTWNRRSSDAATKRNASLRTEQVSHDL